MCLSLTLKNWQKVILKTQCDRDNGGLSDWEIFKTLWNIKITIVVSCWKWTTWRMCHVHPVLRVVRVHGSPTGNWSCSVSVRFSSRFSNSSQISFLAKRTVCMSRVDRFYSWFKKKLKSWIFTKNEINVLVKNLGCQSR